MTASRSYAMKVTGQAWWRVVLTLLLLTSGVVAFGQTPTDTFPKDPAKIAVYALQNLNFGSIYQGVSGGTVIVSPAGVRTATGSVVAINQGVSAFAAIFEVEAPAGTVVTLMNGPDATLVGSNGGTMSMKIGTSSPTSPFNSVITPPGRTQVNVGGTLTVGNATTSKPGNYTGTFQIIFFQQ